MSDFEKICIKSIFAVAHLTKHETDESKMIINFMQQGHTILNHYELHCRIKGSNTIEFNNKSFTANENNVYYLPKNSNARYRGKSHSPTSESEKIIIFFDTDSPMPEEAIMWDLTLNETIRKLVLKIDKYWKSQDMPEANYYMCMSLLYQIFYELSTLSDFESDSPIYNAVAYINDNFTNPDISVEDLSDMCNMSHSHFKRLFISQFGIPPKAYLQKKRMEHARELLRKPKSTIADTAIKSGFSSASYFSKAYKKYYGTSPKESKKSEIS